MTEATPPRPGDRPVLPGSGQHGNTLGPRLALAFLGVALAAVALLAVLTAVFSAADVSSLVGRQRAELASAIAAAAADSWNQGHGWAGANLAPVLDLAAHSGVQAQVRDAAGHAVAATASPAPAAGPQ